MNNVAKYQRMQNNISNWQTSASFQYNCAKNGKGLKIGIKETDTT